ncbi:hypothetical protein N780_02065 [Pontibacillus chungwhensis BH030062]|uniref:Uncharacterized protein n=1 Tax=Pontibacillus chungwhensis BH030062 TaxID=1385513 RepID=A0A0A2UVV6_9BACI|nr:hypothetical protein [Pontibacillus chungwhensis]KGP92407.1 hypothetical protein N780_02065 [Pontibacillus chungwhensis BH030062]
MKKSILLIGAITVCIVLSLSGYVVGTITHNEVSREIRFGYQHSEQANRVDYPHVFTDVENQTIVDNLMMTYLHKEKIESANVNVEEPDLYMSVGSPKQSVILINARIWFSTDGAIVGERRGESWDEVAFYRMDERDARYIMDTIEYEESNQ